MPSVIIIGGGISGLAAAKILRANNWNVTLLEGRNKIGGRAVGAEYFDGNLVEFGSQCIYGELDTIQRFMKDIGLNQSLFGTIEPDDDVYIYNPFIVPGGQILDNDFNKNLVNIVFRLRSKVGSNPNLTIDNIMKIADNEVDQWLIEVNPTDAEKERIKRAMDWLKVFLKEFESPESWFTGEVGNEPVNKTTIPKERCTIQYKAPLGSKALLSAFVDLSLLDDDSMDQNCWIKLNRKVSRIKYDDRSEKDATSSSSGSKVRVFCDNGEKFVADYVLCTIPLGVLKNKYMELFDPQLPMKQIRAINELQTTTFNTIYIKFDEGKWWPETMSGFNLLSTQNDKDYETQGIPIWCKSILFLNRIDITESGIILLGMIFGRDAEIIEETPEENLKEIFQSLISFYIKSPELDQIIPKPTKIKISKWAGDPFSLGAVSFSPFSFNDTLELRRELGSPSVNKKLYFAGEACHTQFPETIHGAYYSGVETALKLIENAN